MDWSVLNQLKQMRLKPREKLTLVLDLDETLVWTELLPNGDLRIFVRLWVAPLLNYCINHSDQVSLVFWTLGKSWYAQHVLSVIRQYVPDLLRYDLLTPDNGFTGYKTMARLREIYPDPIVVVDDADFNYVGDSNIIRVPPYNQEMILLKKADRALIDVLDVVMSIVDNSRPEDQLYPS